MSPVDESCFPNESFLFDTFNSELYVPMKQKLSFSYLNELLKLFGMLIWSSFIFHIVLEIFRLV